MKREEEGRGDLCCLSSSSNETGRCRRAGPGENPYHSPASCQLFWNLLYKFRNEEGGMLVSPHWSLGAKSYQGKKNLFFIFQVQDRLFFFKLSCKRNSLKYHFQSKFSMTEKPLEQKVQRNRFSSMDLLLVLREMWIVFKDSDCVKH